MNTSNVELVIKWDILKIYPELENYYLLPDKEKRKLINKIYEDSEKRGGGPDRYTNLVLKALELRYFKIHEYIETMEELIKIPYFPDMYEGEEKKKYINEKVEQIKSGELRRMPREHQDEIYERLKQK